MRIAVEEPLHGGGKGGVSVYTRNLIRELSLIAPDDEFLLFAYFFREYAEKTAGMTPPPGADYRLLVPQWPESFVRLVEWRLGLPWIGTYLRSAGVDLFHTQRVPRRRLLPTVTTIHDLFPVVHPEWTSYFLTDMWETILKPGMQRTDKVLAVSEHTKKDLVERWAVPPEKIVVTHEGVDTLIFHPVPKDEAEEARRRFGLPERFVLMIGPFDPWCDPSGVLRAAASLPKSLSDAAIVFAGQPGGLAGKAKALAAELGMTARTHWTGYVPQRDLLSFYNLADALVYPSFYEGFGLPVLEAMACGAPVITADAASLPEVAGDAALLVDPEDPEALRGALIRVLDDASLRESLRERGLARAASFTWEKTARATLGVYREVLGR